MTHKQRAVAFAAALAAMAAVPAAAPAHPVDCTGFELEAAPSGERYIDWGGGSDGCVTAASEKASARDAAPPVNSSAAGDRPQGSFEQVGHESLRNRGMNAALAVTRLRLRREPDRRRARGPAAGRPDGGRRLPSRAPRSCAGPFDAGRASPRASCACGAAGHADRAQHQLRRRRRRCTTARCRRSATSASTTSRARTRAAEAAAASSRSTRTSSSCGRTRRTRPGADLRRQRDLDVRVPGGAPSCPFSVWDISEVRERRGARDALQRPVPVQPLPGGAGPGGEADRRPALADDLQRRQPGVLRAADRRLRDRRRVGVRRRASRSRSRGRSPTTSRGRRGPGPGRTARSSCGAATGRGSPTRSTARPPGADHGCPWGWARMVDISDPQVPTVEAEYREPENDPDDCAGFNPPRTSYSAHNPTLTPHVAFSTWHSGGLQAVSSTTRAGPTSWPSSRRSR